LDSKKTSQVIIHDIHK